MLFSAGVTPNVTPRVSPPSCDHPIVPPNAPPCFPNVTPLPPHTPGPAPRALGAGSRVWGGKGFTLGWSEALNSDCSGLSPGHSSWSPWHLYMGSPEQSQTFTMETMAFSEALFLAPSPPPWGIHVAPTPPPTPRTPARDPALDPGQVEG